MKHKTFGLLLMTMSLTLNGCLTEPEDDTEEEVPSTPASSAATTFNLEPASLDEAVETSHQIEAMLAADPSNEEALSAIEILEPRLDALNGLVARVTPRPGHVVSFYEAQPGVLGVSESAPAGADLLLDDNDIGNHAVTELFRLVSNGQEPPAALIEAEEREYAVASSKRIGGGFDAAAPSFLAPDDSDVDGPQALTAGDGRYFRDNYCFNSNADARGCYPNWGNGGWAASNAKTSFFTIAPFSGSVFVRYQFQGSTRLVTPAYSGEVRNYWWHSDWWNFMGGGDYHMRHHRWDVIHASGDSFHWAYAFCWTPSFWQCSIWPR